MSSHKRAPAPADTAENRHPSPTLGRKGLKLLRTDLPKICAGLILVIGATVLSFVRGQLGIWVGGLAVTIILWLVCAYVVSRPVDPHIRGRKGITQHHNWRRLALVGIYLLPIVTVGWAGYSWYQKIRHPINVIILVADFDGPDLQKYHVTETLLSNLKEAVGQYDDVEVTALGRSISEAQGSTAARREGQDRQATIVIWGSYQVKADVVSLSVHFDTPHLPKRLRETEPVATGQVLTQNLAELESFTLQTRLSEEMTYLSLVAVGMARSAIEDWDAAIDRFSAALSHTATLTVIDRSEIYFERGNAYYFKGDTASAIRDYDQVIKLQPNHSHAYTNRGLIYGNNGDYDRALGDLDQAIKLDPNDAAAYNNRVVIYSKKGDYDHLLADLTQLIKLQPNDAETYYNRAITYNNKGEYDRAIADYTQVIKLKPDHEQAYVQRGHIYFNKANYDRAIADYNEVIKLKPNWDFAYSYRGAAYAGKKEYDLALKDLDQAIKMNPREANFYGNRALAYMLKGDYEHALADYELFFKLDPNDAEPYAGRGIVYLKKGDNDRAIADFDQCIKLAPNNDACYVSRASALANKGEHDRAIADLTQAIKLTKSQEELASTYLDRGHNYGEKSDKQNAIADFKKVLELSTDPDERKDAEEKLTELSAK